MLKKDVPVLSAPKWPELAVKEIFPRCRNDDLVTCYFPDEFLKPGGKLPPRDWFWKILWTLRGDFCDDLMVEASEKRAKLAPKRDPKSTILNIGISKEWADILLE